VHAFGGLEILDLILVHCLYCLGLPILKLQFIYIAQLSIESLLSAHGFVLIVDLLLMLMLFLQAVLIRLDNGVVSIIVLLYVCIY